MNVLVRMTTNFDGIHTAHHMHIAMITEMTRNFPKPRIYEQDPEACLLNFHHTSRCITRSVAQSVPGRAQVC
jgi:hypothetical protein